MNFEGQHLHPKIIIAIQKQINEILKKSPDGIKYIQNDIDNTDIQADIHGPVGTPYQNGIFRCKLTLSSEFPRVPPKGYFLTKIFHPNISEKGEICVNTLKKDWDPNNWSLCGIFEVIKCLLIVPFPESALNEEAAKLFMENYEEYFKYAKLLTELHAIPKNLFPSKYTQYSPMKPINADAYIISEHNTSSPIKRGGLISMNTDGYQGTQQEEIHLIKENLIKPIPTSFSQTKPNNNLFTSQGIHPVNNSDTTTITTTTITTTTTTTTNQAMTTLKEDLSDPSKNTDDVLMTVTNSLNANANSLKKVGSFKISSSINHCQGNAASSMSLVANSNNTMPSSGSGSGALMTSAKKENEKKIWMKRI